MRIANLQGRASLVVAGGFVDIALASDGAFSPRTSELLARIDDLTKWSLEQGFTSPSSDELDDLAMDERLSCVVDGPSQVFAVGLNYRQHAHEMGLTNPAQPMIFTKFPSSLAGQHSEIPVVSAFTDWEAELVVVIGRGGRNISLEHALDHVGGFAVGQDMSDRELQMAGSPAQFSLGKSWRNFGPIGPWITTLDELRDPNDLAIASWVNDEAMQDSRTSDMVFSVGEVVSYLSRVVELYPGDVIFTGSPHGVGQGQHPPRFLKPGDRLTTRIEGLGTLHNTMVGN